LKVSLPHTNSVQIDLLIYGARGELFFSDLIQDLTD